MPLLIEAPPSARPTPVPRPEHRLWSTAPLLDLVLQFLDPPALLACLAVSSRWYRSALAILYHSPRLATSADVIALFLSDGPQSRSRKLDALRWVREITLGCTPEEHVSVAHLRRALAQLGSSETGRVLPRLRVLRLAYSLEGWKQLLTPPIESARPRPPELAGVELIHEQSPPVVGQALIELLTAPTVVLTIAKEDDPGETHVHLLPRQYAALVALLAPLHQTATTGWSFDRVFFHVVRPRYHPLPTLLFNSETAPAVVAPVGQLELHFAPLSIPSRTTPGLSLNPWDRRHSILSAAAAAAASLATVVIVNGIPPSQLDLLPATDGLTYVPAGSTTTAAGEAAEAAARELPTLSAEQVGALFYRGLGVGWAALSHRVLSFNSVRA
jgi:hypothetical protein